MGWNRQNELPKHRVNIKLLECSPQTISSLGIFWIPNYPLILAFDSKEACGEYLEWKAGIAKLKMLRGWFTATTVRDSSLWRAESQCSCGGGVREAWALMSRRVEGQQGSWWREHNFGFCLRWFHEERNLKVLIFGFGNSVLQVFLLVLLKLKILKVFEAW